MCFQLFSGGDGDASGVGSGEAAEWSFGFLGFGSVCREAFFRVDGGGPDFSSDVFYFSGGRAKLLILHGDSDECAFGPPSWFRRWRDVGRRRSFLCW
jgi:hypothetical protein